MTSPTTAFIAGMATAAGIAAGLVGATMESNDRSMQPISVVQQRMPRHALPVAEIAAATPIEPDPMANDDAQSAGPTTVGAALPAKQTPVPRKSPAATQASNSPAAAPRTDEQNPAAAVSEEALAKKKQEQAARAKRERARRLLAQRRTREQQAAQVPQRDNNFSFGDGGRFFDNHRSGAFGMFR